MRIRVLAGARDMSHWMEEEEGGKQRSAWDIVAGLAERGRLGYKEEETVRVSAFVFVSLDVMGSYRWSNNPCTCYCYTYCGKARR